MKLKQNKISIIILILLIGTMGIGMAAAVPPTTAADEYDDPKDDIYCMSMWDLYEIIYSMGFDASDTDMDVYNQIGEAIIEEGTQSCCPNCIDVISYEADQGDTNTTVTITTQDTISDCSESRAQIFLADDSDDGIGLVWDGSSFEYYDVEADTTHAAEGDVSGDTLTIEFPNSVYDYNEDGDFVGMLMTLQGTGSDPMSGEACIDMFPNSGYGDIDPGLYDGGEPITEFVDDIANFLLPWMCRSGAFILVISALALIGKVLIDRKNLYLRIPGGVLLGFLIYPEIFYLLDINLTTATLQGIVFGIMDLIAVISLILFSAFQFMNNFNLLDDNAWSIILPSVLILAEGIMFLTPFFGCITAIYTIITIVIWAIILTAGLMLTEKYSKERLK